MSDSEEPKPEEQAKKRVLSALLHDAADFIGLANTFAALRGDLAEMRKAWKTLVILVVVLIVAVATLSTKPLVSTHVAEEQALAADYNRKITERDKELNTLRFNLQQAQARADKAELVALPWKEKALREFPFDDVTSALAKLDAKADTLFAMLRSSIANPLNEPITSATCTVRIETTSENKGDNKVNIALGGYAAFVANDSACWLPQPSITSRDLTENMSLPARPGSSTPSWTSRSVP